MYNFKYYIFEIKKYKYVTGVSLYLRRIRTSTRTLISQVLTFTPISCEGINFGKSNALCKYVAKDAKIIIFNNNLTFTCFLSEKIKF